MELQLAGNGVFLSQALESSHPKPWQVPIFQSDSTSKSDSEISDLGGIADIKSNSPWEQIFLGVCAFQ